jgi:hypothetical protein
MEETVCLAVALKPSNCNTAVEAPSPSEGAVRTDGFIVIDVSRAYAGAWLLSTTGEGHTASHEEQESIDVYSTTGEVTQR